MIANQGSARREQLAILAALDAHSFFATVPIVAYDNGDLASLETAMLNRITAKGGKLGLSIQIEQPRLTVLNPDQVKILAGVTFKPLLLIELDIVIIEDLLANRDAATGTGIPALTAAEAVVAVLHQPVSASRRIARYCDSITPLAAVDPATGIPDLNQLGYRVTLRTEAWATADQPTAVDPGP